MTMRLSSFAHPALLVFAVLGSPIETATAATPGHPTCQALEKQCLAFAALLRQGASRPIDAQNPATPSSDAFCYDSFHEAQKTNLWPAVGPRPEIGCVNE